MYTYGRLLLGRKAMTNLDSLLKSRDRDHFANKGPYNQSYGFSSSHVWMWELDHKGGWVLKNWCFWTVVLEKTLESPLDCKEIQPVHPKGNQSWVFIGRTVPEAEDPIFWPPHVKSQLLRKGAGKDWRQEEERGERMRQLDRTTYLEIMERRREEPGLLWPMGLQTVRHDWATEQQRGWFTMLTSTNTTLQAIIFQ